MSKRKKPTFIGLQFKFISNRPAFVNFYACVSSLTAKAIIHEMGKFLYGAFEEQHQTSDDPKFYHDESGQVTPVACSTGIAGSTGQLAINDTTKSQFVVPGSACPIDPETELPTDDCSFWPNATHPQVTASLMDIRSVFVPDVSCPRCCTLYGRGQKDLGVKSFYQTETVLD